jgi:hypothetical protein
MIDADRDADKERLKLLLIGCALANRGVRDRVLALPPGVLDPQMVAALRTGRSAVLKLLGLADSIEESLPDVLIAEVMKGVAK